MRRFFFDHPQALPLVPLFVTLLITHSYLDLPILTEILATLFLGMSFWLIFKEFRIFVDQFASALFTTLSILSSIAFLGALLIFFGRWNSSTLGILLLTPLFVFLFLHFVFHKETGGSQEIVDGDFRFNTKECILPFLLFFVLIGINVWFLAQGKTTEPTNSPWNLVDPRFFISIFLQYILLVFIGFKFPKNPWVLLVQILHVFFLGTLVLILFPLGYGFDPTIHETTLQHILNEGSITPKTPYYQGYYSFVLFFSDLFSFSVSLVNRFFLPILGVVLLPLTLYLSFRKMEFPFLGFPFLLLFPFSLFIHTTPQSVANFFLLIFIFFIISPERQILPKKLTYFFFVLMALAILTIHPLSGIAAIIVFTVFLVPLPFRRILLFLEAFLAPAMFFILEYIRNGKITFSFQWKNPFQFLLPQTMERFIFLEDLFYVVSEFILIGALFVILLGSLMGFFKNKMLFRKCLLASGMILLNGIFTFWFIRFSYLIPYEQNAFSFRLFEMAMYPLLPLVLFTLLKTAKRIPQKSVIPFIILISFLGFSVFYLSFPRNDHFTKSKLYNLSEGDLEAVSFIQSHENGTPYVVLANQMTSLAALKQYGFKNFLKTSKGDLYFYPIPTSSPLYDAYLEMAEGNPSEKVLKGVRELMGVEKIFMIFPSYWTNFEAQRKKISQIAKQTIELHDGKIIVFEF